LKLTIPQKVRLASATVADSDFVPSQNKQPLPEANRRAGTSAAAIGLALSVGAHCLLLPRQGDNAVAAEPVISETATDVASLSPGAMTSATVPVSGDREHIVQAGQSLWQVANSYGVSASSIAILNRIPLDAVLKVGQVLRIPTDLRVARLSNDGVVNDSTIYYGSMQSTEDAASKSDNKAVKQAEIDDSLRLSQTKALSILNQARKNLKVSLQGLETGKVNSALPVDDTLAPVVPQLVPPSDAPRPLQAQSAKTIKTLAYQVVPGDTISIIARTYGVSQEELIKTNRIADPNFLVVGQYLKISSSSRSAVVNASVAVADQLPITRSATGEPSDPTQLLATSLPKAAPFEPQESMAFQTKVASPPVALPAKPLPVVGSDSSGSRDNLARRNTQVAAAPLAASSASELSNSPSARYGDIETLRNQITEMRQKYHASLASAVGSGMKVATPSLGSASPRIALSKKAEDLPQKTENSSIESLQQLKPQVVATAPVGSEAYEPSIPAFLTKIVSPTLPSIGPGENYLPQVPNQFTGYIWPTKGVFTSGYGWRWGRMHRGIDIAGPVGTPIVAAASGIVVTAGWNSGGYGNVVDIRHADGSITRYAHNNRILVRSGQSVEQGQQIAEMGSTGFSTGPHSHFEVHLPGQGAVNPMAYLPRSGA